MCGIQAMNKTLALESIDLNLLVVFDAILKERNITRAAKRVGLSQPAMSSALARLRKTFNDPLFVRTARGMQPTPYAELLAPPIQRACELVASSLTLGAAFEPRASTRTFTVYLTDIGQGIFLPKLLPVLEERAPRVRMKVLRIPERGAHEAMTAGDVDLAVGLFPDLKAGIFQQRLYRDEFVCLIRADHPRAKGGISVKQFAEMRHAVVSTAGTGHDAAIERAFAEQRQHRRVALTIPNWMAVPIIVARTDCIVTVPRRLAVAFASFPGIRIVDPPIRIEPFDIRQHWHERYHHDPANRWLRGLVAELFLE
jgi:DNA-binding transcriptional LysR family regulator